MATHISKQDGTIRIIIMKRKGSALAANDDWFYNLSEEKQRAYIEEHPNSKFAKNHRGGLAEEEERKKKPKKEKVGFLSVKSVFGIKLNSVPDVHKAFFDNEQDKPGSDERKGIAKHIRTKKHKIIGHMKNQIVEWKDGCGAITKLASGKEISEHEKKALKALVIDAAVIAGSVAITGGFSHGAALAMKHVGFDVLKDVVLKTVIRGTTRAMGASTGVTGLVGLEALASTGNNKQKQQDKLNEKILSMLVDKMADLMENGDIPQDAWEKVLDELSKTKPKKK